MKSYDELKTEMEIIQEQMAETIKKEPIEALKKEIVNIEQAKEIVISAISDALEGKADVTEDMQLIGGESLLDSLKLVEVCLALEDLADEHGFEFDWTSESAMSKSRSMFRSVTALAEEFVSQSVS